jgi:hypothetical protein
MSRFDHTLRPFALLACLALLLAAVGCNEGSVLAPVDDPGSVGTEPVLLGISSTPDDPASTNGDKVSGGFVSAEFGGKVTNGRITLEFPAGALDEDTYITMEMVDRSELVVEFGPHGLVFNKPVTITWKLNGTARENLAETTVIKWRNPETNALEDVYTFPADQPNRVRGLLEHFSDYNAIEG